MSMIMRVARGTASDLERLDGDGGAGSAALDAALGSRLAALANLPPETRARLLAQLQSQPQLARLSPKLLEGLRRGLTVVPPSSPAAGNGRTEPQRPVATVEGPETLDLHKSWHVFHFLFTGRAGEGGTPPANLLLEGGREIGADMGYGPARLLDPAETAAFSRFLDRLSVAELTDRLDAPRMAALGIYCAGDGSDDEAEELAGDVAHYFPRLQAFFQRAAQAGESTLVWLS